MFTKVGMTLARLVPEGTSVPIVRGPLAGCRWIAGAAAGDGRGLSVVFGACETPLVEAMAELVKPTDVCFDLGANVGLYTLLLARLGQHVVAFEPLPRNIEYLHRTLTVNRTQNATIVPWAVADVTGLALFEEGANCALGRLASQGSQPVATVSLDDYADKYGVVPSFVKMDVEGAEVAVLDGARRILREYHPRLLIELHGAESEAGCRERLQSAGYTSFRLISPGELLASA